MLKLILKPTIEKDGGIRWLPSFEVIRGKVVQVTPLFWSPTTYTTELSNRTIFLDESWCHEPTMYYFNNLYEKI